MDNVRKLVIFAVLLALLLLFSEDIHFVYDSNSERVKKVKVQLNSTQFELITPKEGLPLEFEPVETGSETIYSATIELISSTNTTVIPLKTPFPLADYKIENITKLEDGKYKYTVRIFVKEKWIEKFKNKVEFVGVGDDTNYVFIKVAGTGDSQPSAGAGSSDTPVNLGEVHFGEYWTPARTYYNATITVVVESLADNYLSIKVESDDINIVDRDIISSEKLYNNTYRVTLELYTDESIFEKNNSVVTIVINNKTFEFTVVVDADNSDSQPQPPSGGGGGGLAFSYAELKMKYDRFASYTYRPALLSDSAFAVIDFANNRVDEYSVALTFAQIPAVPVELIERGDGRLILVAMTNVQSNSVAVIELRDDFTVISAQKILFPASFTADRVAVTSDDTNSKIYISVRAVENSKLVIYTVEVSAYDFIVVNTNKITFNKTDALASQSSVYQLIAEDNQRIASVVADDKLFILTAVSDVQMTASDRAQLLILTQLDSATLSAEKSYYIYITDTRVQNTYYDYLIERKLNENAYLSISTLNSTSVVFTVELNVTKTDYKQNTVENYKEYRTFALDTRDDRKLSVFSLNIENNYVSMQKLNSHKLIQSAFYNRELDNSIYFFESGGWRTLYTVDESSIPPSLMSQLSSTVYYFDDYFKSIDSEFVLINTASKSYVSVAEKKPVWSWVREEAYWWGTNYFGSSYFDSADSEVAGAVGLDTVTLFATVYDYTIQTLKDYSSDTSYTDSEFAVQEQFTADSRVEVVKLNRI